MRASQGLLMVLPLINSVFAGALALWIRSRATFAVLHRSAEFGTDWVGPWWSVLALSGASLSIFLLGTFGARDDSAGPLRRLMIVAQTMIMLSTMILAIWNR
ncbi:hypothetical protein HZA86_04225 [Candidatus Uhrbacteria bacterium]|nr:hypothetical protein [Candidatus Uhrbacteria bacterium]